MTKIKVREATVADLDWMVAKAEGWSLKAGVSTWFGNKPWFERRDESGIYRRPRWELTYSTDWTLAGPIIEREGINVGTQRNEPGFRPHPDLMWHAWLDTRVYVGYGLTPLIAAMRCYVTSKLGEIVDVPDVLLENV